jgi:hypothetical protein
MRQTRDYMAIPDMDTNADHERNDTSLPRDEASPLGTKGVMDGESKDLTPNMAAMDSAAAIPKGTIDPVYEAKARVLNNAVWMNEEFFHGVN